MSRRMTRVAAGMASAVLLSSATACTSSSDEKDPPDLSGQGEVSGLKLTSAVTTTDEAPDGLPPDATVALTVKFQDGVTWSDGSPLTSRDFAGYYDILWAYGDPIWEDLVDVTTPDDQTLMFALTSLSPTVERSLLRANQTGATSQFGAYYDRAHELRTSGTAQDDPAVAKLVEELGAAKFEETVSYGPFAIDPDSVSTQQLTLEKNDGGLNASEIDLSEVIVYWGQTEQSLPLALSGDLDYSTDAYSQSAAQSIDSQPGFSLIRSPLNVGAAVWFNESDPLFAQKEFRQAVAYALNREQNAKVALGDAAKPMQYDAGFSDNLVNDWLSDEDKSQLNDYAFDTDKAAELLEGIGLTKNGDTWEESGQPVSFSLTAPTTFPDFLASAKDVAQQLNDFGFKVTVKGIPDESRIDTIAGAKYDALLDFGLVSTPSHPQTSLDWNMAAGFFGTNNPEAGAGESKGLNFPWEQTAPDGTEVYIPDLLDQSIEGTDKEQQKAAVATLASIYNEQLPTIPLYERYTTDPINDGARVTGWLPQDDPIYQNNQGSDNYVAMQILNGLIKPVDGADGSFRTNLPFVQPPDFSWSFFGANSLVQSFSSPAYHLVFPPLFWYSEAQETYVPSVGDSVEIYSAP